MVNELPQKIESDGQSDESLPVQPTTEVPNRPEFAADFTEKELQDLEDTVGRLTTAESEAEEKKIHVPTWEELTEEQRRLLIKRYGEPRRVARMIRITDYTSGEGCADNERGLPSDFKSEDFGIWDKHLLVFSLYSRVPNIESSTKIRIVPGGMVIGTNGRVLLPDFFYTPAGGVRRALLISQMNRNPRGDKSLRLAEAYAFGQVDSGDLEVTVYRRVGTRMSAGDQFSNSRLGRKAMESLGLNSIGGEDRQTRHRQTIDVSRKVQEGIAEIVTTSNLMLIKKAFESEAVQTLSLKDSAFFIEFIDIATGSSELIYKRDFSRLNLQIRAVKDPTWQYKEEKRPLVFMLESGDLSNPDRKYGYISNTHDLE